MATTEETLRQSTIEGDPITLTELRSLVESTTDYPGDSAVRFGVTQSAGAIYVASQVVVTTNAEILDLGSL